MAFVPLIILSPTTCTNCPNAFSNKKIIPLSTVLVPYPEIVVCRNMLSLSLGAEHGLCNIMVFLYVAEGFVVWRDL